MRWMRLSFNSKSDGFPHPDYENLSLADVTLATDLVRNGDSHAKTMRFVQVWLEIEAPRYFWQEWDQYKFTLNCIPPDTFSESTMHTITKHKLTRADFEDGDKLPSETLGNLNELISRKCVREVKQQLPESFLQKRGTLLSYQTIRHMVLDRKQHKLIEWKQFIQAMEKLPLYKELILGEIE